MSTPKKELEVSVEDYLVAGVEKLGGECLKLEVKGRRGWPDRLCVLPGGVHMFIELKRPKGGVLSRQQQSRIDWLCDNGHMAIAVKNRAEVDAVLDALAVMSGVSK